MKKSYIVTYMVKSSTTTSRATHLREVLKGMGYVTPLTSCGRVCNLMIVPSDEKVNAAEILHRLRMTINTFDEGVCVLRVNILDVAETDVGGCAEVLKHCTGDAEDEPRNYNRFRTRHEAFVQYELEKPRWVYKDGMGVAVRVDFDEWCWLPIRKDGIYEKGKYDKYLR